jgi:prevent-host-death family protein
MIVKNMVMIKTNVAEVKAKLSEYLDRALGGERIVICRHNKPIAELRAFEDTRVEPRPIGPLPGRPSFDVPPSFFEPLAEDDLDLWEGAASRGASSEDRRTSSAMRVAERKTSSRPSGKRTPSRRS